MRKQVSKYLYFTYEWIRFPLVVVGSAGDMIWGQQWKQWESSGLTLQNHA